MQRPREAPQIKMTLGSRLSPDALAKLKGVARGVGEHL